MVSRGSIVKILPKESYWFNKFGTVEAVYESRISYLAVVEFEKSRASTTHFDLD